MSVLLFPRNSALKLLTNRSFLNKASCMHRCLSCTVRSSTTEQSDELYKNFSFDILKQSKDSKARYATIKTPHGTIETPNFVFCATRGAMKALTPQQLRDEGTQIILSNTYHMMISPGADVVEKLGGLQKFTAWNGPMLTDSGGYQIFSMGHGSVASEIKGNRNNSMVTEQLLLKIDEQGATFKSYVDGTKHILTPEKSIDIQRKLGADLIVVLDECTPFNVDKEYTLNSMRRSHRWAKRSLIEFKRTNTGKQALYGIVQGGIYHTMRDESTEFINNHEFFGTAIGGSLGNTRKGMHDIVAYTRSKVRDDRPVHLLGIGGVIDIFNGVRQGIDTFDCVSPMRLARHAGALVKASYWEEELHPYSINEAHQDAVKIATRTAEKIQEKEKHRLFSLNYNKNDNNTTNNTKEKKDKINKNINLNLMPLEETEYYKSELKKLHNIIDKKYSERIISDHIKLKSRWMRGDPRPIDVNCSCYTCKNYSRGYLKHCFSNGEFLGGTLVSIHNAHFMNKLMKDIRYSACIV